MSYPVPFATALWIWLALAVLVAAGLIVLHCVLLAASDEEWPARAAALAVLVTSTGFVFCPLLILGYPRLGLWTWRIVSGAGVVLGIAMLVRMSASSRSHNSAADWLSIIGATAFGILVLILGVLSRFPQTPSVAVTAGSLQNVGESLSRMDFWQTASLVILACGTVLFALLFISAMQRQGLIWFESHSGGLGGGVGGWRISSSMAYLIAAVLFGVLFGSVLAHEDGLKNRAPGPTSAVEEHAPAAAGTPKANPKPRTESEAPPPSGPPTSTH